MSVGIGRVPGWFVLGQRVAPRWLSLDGLLPGMYEPNELAGLRDEWD